MSIEDVENAEDLFAFNRIIYRMAVNKYWLSLFINKALYDPKYGIHTTLDTITPEHMS